MTEARAVTLSIERAEALVEEFLAAYPVASIIGFKIRETQEELYGPQATREAVGTIYGSFHPRQGRSLYAAANFSTDHEFRRSLRHEILGHFGINTFNRSEKRSLLDAIVDARAVPSLAPLWQHVDRHYSGMSDSRKAEEVFAFACERIEPGMSIDQSRCIDSFLDVCIDRIRPLELQDLRHITSLVAQGLHDCTRSLRIIPESDNDQFRQSLTSVEISDTSYAEPSLEEQLLSQQGGQSFDFDDEPSLADQMAAQAGLRQVDVDSQMQHDEEPEMHI